MAIFYFYRTNTLFGKLVRFVSNGYYNHVVIEVNGYMYESNPMTGVTKKPATSAVGAVAWRLRTDLNDEEVIYFLEGQLGKKYDYIGCLSFIWVFLKPRIGKWYCSELAMVTLMKGLGVHSSEYNQKQSPMDMYYLSKLIKS